MGERKLQKEGSISLGVKLQLFWYLFVVALTEGLSFFNILNRANVLIAYVLFVIALALLFGRRIYFEFKKPIIISFFGGFLFLLFALTFFQGLFSAPNTTDSMVYHIPRVMYWIQNQSVFHNVIQTSHDFMPPFAEYVLLNVYLLVNGDRFLFISQWISYVSSILLTGLIVRNLGVDVGKSKLIMLLIASLPILVLQSVSTQTDLIVLNLLLISHYIVLSDFAENKIGNIALLGLSLGLGILTKPTFFIFSVIPLGTLVILGYRNISKLARSILIIAGAFVLILTPYFKQNLNLYGSVLGQSVLEKDNTYVNEIFTIPATVSNAVRNLIINIPVPVFYENVMSSIEKFHSLLGVEINDLKTTFRATPFGLLKIIYPQEDAAANPLHLIVIALAMLALFWKRSWRNRNAVLVFCMSVISFILFSAVLRWQLFNIRLQIPFLVVGSIAGCVILFGHRFGKRLISLLVLVSLPLAVMLVLLNVSRPYVSYRLFLDKIGYWVPQGANIPQAFYEKPRTLQYFNPRWYWYEPYKLTTGSFINKNEAYEINFDLMDEYEYPLWVLLIKDGVKFKAVSSSAVNENTLIISTSPLPLEKEGYNTVCYKTQIEYGYACVSKLKNGSI